ncbi:MAG: hypothetical protein PHT30_05355 [Bacilli bacterium]|jgi:hypothetical protein|nr:hypothetical protein [Bacilli bacterium]
MIDKEKYLYWMNPDDPLFESQLIMREMYSRIGFIFHVIQMAEYNLANILAIEEFEKETSRLFSVEDIERIKSNIDIKFRKLSTLTFGRLKKIVEQSVYLKSIDMDILSKVVDYRNYLAHQCFKEKLLNNDLQTLQDVDKFIEQLNDFEEMITDFNDWLVSVFADKKVKSILVKLSK